MKFVFYSLSLITTAVLLIACQEAEVEIVEEETVPEVFNNGPKQNFTTAFAVEPIKDDYYALKLTVTPGQGAFFASPHCKDQMKGALNVEVQGGIVLKMETSWEESPASVAVYDKFSDTDVKWVYDETTYAYRFKVLSDQDFNVSGIASFVIEPECNRYETGFTIIQKDGVLSVVKTTTKIRNLTE